LDSHRRQEGNCYKYIFLVWPFQTSNDTFGKNKHCPLHFHTLDEIFLTKDVTGLKTPLSTESVLVETLKKREENIEKPACLIIDGKIIFTKLKAFEGHFWLIDMINDWGLKGCWFKSSHWCFDPRLIIIIWVRVDSSYKLLIVIIFIIVIMWINISLTEGALLIFFGIRGWNISDMAGDWTHNLRSRFSVRCLWPCWPQVEWLLLSNIHKCQLKIWNPQSEN